MTEHSTPKNTTCAESGTGKDAALARLSATLDAIADGQLEKILDPAEEKLRRKIRSRALRLLDQRGRSRQEMVTRLQECEFPRAMIDIILDDFESQGLISDEIFAREWVRQRHTRRGKARSVLRKELQDKGIPHHLIEDALSLIRPEQEQMTARRLAAKKAASIKNPPADWNEKQKMLRRIVGVLARRGFPEGMARGIARDALEHRLLSLECPDDFGE